MSPTAIEMNAVCGVSRKNRTKAGKNIDRSPRPRGSASRGGLSSSDLAKHKGYNENSDVEGRASDSSASSSDESDNADGVNSNDFSVSMSTPELEAAIEATKKSTGTKSGTTSKSKKNRNSDVPGAFSDCEDMDEVNEICESEYEYSLPFENKYPWAARGFFLFLWCLAFFLLFFWHAKKQHHHHHSHHHDAPNHTADNIEHAEHSGSSTIINGDRMGDTNQNEETVVT